MLIQWEAPPNRDCHLLHVDYRLFVYHDQLEDYDTVEFNELDEDKTELIRMIRSIHGVTQASIGLYRIQIMKGKLISWDSIRPRVESVLAEWSGQEIEVAGAVVDLTDPTRNKPWKPL